MIREFLDALKRRDAWYLVQNKGVSIGDVEVVEKEDEDVD